eukprot:gb/GECH01014714.1/.p1 GENE.gb/GECH01014714.1/~~gb/GECH01014714.1/.p1  ORF type:complete len:165 (+),score=30.97 gb/GECH01014714.1/:1-495(+)
MKITQKLLIKIILLILFVNLLFLIFFTWKSDSLLFQKILGFHRQRSITKDEIGHATWTMLHSMASSLDDNVDQNTAKQIISFISSIPNLFPCEICGQHFQDDVLPSISLPDPSDARFREKLVIALCSMHNQVNERLHKPQVSCVLQELDQRWRLSNNGEGCPVS